MWMCSSRHTIQCEVGAACCRFSSYASNPAEEQFQTAGYMIRPRGPRPGGDVHQQQHQQQFPQHTLQARPGPAMMPQHTLPAPAPSPAVMPQAFHGAAAPAMRDHGAQERFLREIQRNPSRCLFHVFSVSEVRLSDAVNFPAPITTF